MQLRLTCGAGKVGSPGSLDFEASACAGSDSRVRSEVIMRRLTARTLSLGLGLSAGIAACVCMAAALALAEQPASQLATCTCRAEQSSARAGRSCWSEIQIVRRSRLVEGNATQ